MRHSKAGQTSKNMLSDHDRLLTKKGEDLCEEIAGYFNKFYKDSPPEHILCSSTARAKQTAALFNKFFEGKEIPTTALPELYITRNNEILEAIQNVDNNINSILIIGHNPGLQQFAMEFAHDGDKKKFREMKSNFAPGSFATFNADHRNWSNIRSDSGILLDFVNGKKIKIKPA